jgi:hypothetical protein
MPPEGMEFYRTGAPDRPEGIRGTSDRPVLVDPVYGEVVDDKPIFEAQPPEIGDYEGINIEKIETEIPEEISIINRIKKLTLSWGGIIDWPSFVDLKKTSKQLARSIKNQVKTALKKERLGPNKLSAEENAEIDEIIFYMKEYPEVWNAIETARQGGNRQFNEMSDTEIARYIKSMEQEGISSLGGRSIIKKKRKRKRNGYSKTWNY